MIYKSKVPAWQLFALKRGEWRPIGRIRRATIEGASFAASIAVDDRFPVKAQMI